MLTCRDTAQDSRNQCPDHIGVGTRLRIVELVWRPMNCAVEGVRIVRVLFNNKINYYFEIYYRFFIYNFYGLFSFFLLFILNYKDFFIYEFYLDTLTDTMPRCETDSCSGTTFQIPFVRIDSASD